MRDTHHFGSGELIRYLYRLGRHEASGVLTVTPNVGRHEMFALRRGCAVANSGRAQIALISRLARLVSFDCITTHFDGGVSACPPGAQHQLSLAQWVRNHAEQQLGGALGEMLLREFAGVRLVVRPELAPLAQDEADKRMLAAMAEPHRLDQIWTMARTPRFRLLAFLHFLRVVGALEVRGVAARVDAATESARRLLGVEPSADRDDIKRAYRRLARALHPDLQPGIDAERRRLLERKFAEVTAAYEAIAAT